MNDAFSVTRLEGPFGYEVSVYHSDGLIWASIPQWCTVLQAPYFMPEYLLRNVDTLAASMKGGQYAAVVGVNKLYRWPVIAASLDLWHRTWMVLVSKGEHVKLETNKRAASEQFAMSIIKLKQWGYDLQERELQTAMSAKMTPKEAASGLAEIHQAIHAINALAHVTRNVLEKHGEAIDDHEDRISGIERADPALRNPEEFVTIKQRCTEVALSLGFVVDGRMNISQACGMYLKRKGAKEGAPMHERLDGRTQVVQVTTWCRADIDDAIAHYLPEFPLPKKGC